MAIICHTGAFQFTRMPFELTNEPACFQRTRLCTKYKWKTCIVYLDDLFLFSRNAYYHITKVDDILTTLTEVRVTLKINKCHYFNNKLSIWDT